jgi:hypothetical protein
MNFLNSNSFDSKGYFLDWDQNILELYFHVYGQLKQMSGEHANIRGFFLFCFVFFSDFLIFGDFFPKFLTKFIRIYNRKRNFPKLFQLYCQKSDKIS